MGEITDAFEDLSHAMRGLLEAHVRANRDGLLRVDRAEAVGNIETNLGSVLNGFHSLHDAMGKSSLKDAIDWYGTSELATILILRNARHHNHASKVRTLYSFYAQEGERIGNLEMYILVDFPALEDGADTFDVYLSWADLERLFRLPQEVTRIRPETANDVQSYLNTNRFPYYAEEYELGEDRIFFNLIPLIVNAGIKLIPLIKSAVKPRSMESEAYLSLFENVEPADTRNHDVNCGPIAFMP